MKTNPDDYDLRRYGVVAYGTRENALGACVEVTGLLGFLEYLLDDENPEVMIGKIESLRENLHD